MAGNRREPTGCFDRLPPRSIPIVVSPWTDKVLGYRRALIPRWRSLIRQCGGAAAATNFSVVMMVGVQTTIGRQPPGCPFENYLSRQ